MTVPIKDTVPTEAVVQLSPDATPFKNTAVGKTTRTLFQNIIGAIGVAIPILALSDDVRTFVVSNPEWGWVPLALAVAGAVVTYLQNTLEDSVIASQVE